MKKIPVYDSLDDVIAAEDFGDVSAGSRIMIKNLPGVSITSKPRRDGRYQGYCISGDIKTYFYGRTQEEVAVKIKHFLQSGGVRKRKKRKDAVPTFGEYAEKWYRLYKEPLLKPGSLRTVRYSIKPALDAWRDRKLNTITTDDAQEVANAMTSPVFRKLFVTYGKDIFKRAMQSGFVKSNPFELVAIVPPKKRHRAALTREQQAALVEHVQDKPYDLITRFLLATGLRIGEALALTKADIKDGRVYVSKNLVRLNRQDIVQDAPKTAAGNRAVPISRELEVELLAQPGNRLFTRTQGVIAGNFRTVSAKVGFHVSAHILRHTYATRLEEAGVPAKVAQYLMGHATIQMTKDVYTDVQDRYIKTFDERVIMFTDTQKRED